MLPLVAPRDTNLRSCSDLCNDSGILLGIAQCEKTCCSGQVCYVRVPGTPELIPVSLRGDVIGAAHQPGIFRRPVHSQAASDARPWFALPIRMTKVREVVKEQFAGHEAPNIAGNLRH